MHSGIWNFGIFRTNRVLLLRGVSPILLMHATPRDTTQKSISSFFRGGGFEDIIFSQIYYISPSYPIALYYSPFYSVNIFVKYLYFCHSRVVPFTFLVFQKQKSRSLRNYMSFSIKNIKTASISLYNSIIWLQILRQMIFILKYYDDQNVFFSIYDITFMLNPIVNSAEKLLEDRCLFPRKRREKARISVMPIVA